MACRWLRGGFALAGPSGSPTERLIKQPAIRGQIPGSRAINHPKPNSPVAVAGNRRTAHCGYGHQSSIATVHFSPALTWTIAATVSRPPSSLPFFPVRVTPLTLRFAFWA